MKKLHLLTSNDSLRQKFNYIQIKDGQVIATDCFKLAKFPFKDVFGELETELTEFYINGENWKKCKFYNALRFEIENGYLIGYDKKGKMGICEILTNEQFTEKCGLFPDPEIIFKDLKSCIEIDSISFNAEKLLELCEAMGGYAFNYLFYGKTKAIIVESKGSEIQGLLMPTIY